MYLRVIKLYYFEIFCDGILKNSDKPAPLGSINETVLHVTIYLNQFSIQQ